MAYRCHSSWLVIDRLSRSCMSFPHSNSGKIRRFSGSEEGWVFATDKSTWRKKWPVFRCCFCKLYSLNLYLLQRVTHSQNLIVGDLKPINARNSFSRFLWKYGITQWIGTLCNCKFLPFYCFFTETTILVTREVSLGNSKKLLRFL